eukprot:jgi/Orpsp1_1/1191392/evm.model.d7180000085417.1
MKSNKVSHHQPPNSSHSSYHSYGLKSHNHNKYNVASARRAAYGRFSLAPKCVTTVVTKTTTELPLLLSNTHLPNKLDPTEYPLANLQTSLKRFCYDNNGIPTYKKTNDNILLKKTSDDNVVLKKKNRYDTSASTSTTIKNLPSPTLSPTPLTESRQFLSSPVENSNHSINIPNNMNEIDSDEVMVTGEASSSSSSQGDHHYHKNSHTYNPSPTRSNKINDLKQKEGLNDEEILEIENNKIIDNTRNFSRKIYKDNSFRGFVEEDTDEEESIIEEEEEDEMVDEGRISRHHYYPRMSKYKSLGKSNSSNYPAHLNPIITSAGSSQDLGDKISGNYYGEKCSCENCENCSDQEMFNEYNQYDKRSLEQQQQDPLSPYSGSSPPTALSDVPNIVSMYDELNPNTQSLVLLRLLKRCPVSTLQFVSSLILPVLKYDIISLLPVELTYKILNYLDIEDLYHCMMVCHGWKKIIDSPGAELAIWKQKLIEKQWYDEEKIHAILTEYKQRKLKAKAKKASKLLLLQHSNSEYLMNALSASNSNTNTNSSSSYSTSSSSSSSSSNSTNNNTTTNNNSSIDNNNNEIINSITPTNTSNNNSSILATMTNSSQFNNSSSNINIVNNANFKLTNDIQ